MYTSRIDCHDGTCKLNVYAHPSLYTQILRVCNINTMLHVNVTVIYHGIGDPSNNVINMLIILTAINSSWQGTEHRAPLADLNAATFSRGLPQAMRALWEAAWAKANPRTSLPAALPSVLHQAPMISPAYSSTTQPTQQGLVPSGIVVGALWPEDYLDTSRRRRRDE